MSYGRKLLLTSNVTSNATPSQLPAASPPAPPPMEAEFVVVLAALLCAIVCVLALIVVARCAWLRRGRGNDNSSNKLANKGLKKKVLNTLPKYIHKADTSPAGEVNEVDVEEDDCVICLAEYVDGDEIRVLPQCGHRFHVGCIDTWLASHSSCPSCRQILAPIRCQKCGECPVARSGEDGGSESRYNSGKLSPNCSGSNPSPVFLV